MGTQPVVKTAMLRCSFGTAPATLNILSQQTVKICGQNAATIMENKLLNFGTCNSPSHPTMVSTGSPGPCMGAAQVVAPWTPGSPTVRIGGLPAVPKNCKLMCNFGGVIETAITPALTVKIG